MFCGLHEKFYLCGSKREEMYKVNFIVDMRRRAAKGYPVKAVVSGDGWWLRISIGMYAENDLVGGEYQASEENARLKNIALNKIKYKVNEALLQLGDRKISQQAMKSLIDETINGKRVKRFLDYVDEYIATIPVKSTQTTYLTMRNKVEEYDRTVILEGVNYVWLTKFEQWMIGKEYGVNYYGQIERSIRKVFNYCIDCEYTEQYPFRRFKCKSGKTAKRNLSVEELRSLRDWPCEKWQEEYRDMFMLQVYMLGIDAVDLFNLPAVKNLRVGSKIEFKRIKVGKKDAGYVCFSLCQEAYDIIQKYAGEKHLVNVLDGRYKDYRDYLHHMNDALKKIGKKTKTLTSTITKPVSKTDGHTDKKSRKGSWKIEYETEFPGLSSKWSRHTWATLAAEAGVTRDIIGLALGHADDSVTSIYIEYERQKKSDEANAKVLELLDNGQRTT